MTSASLWARAAESYRATGALAEAARCFHNAGLHAEARFFYQKVGMHAEVAAEYEASGHSVNAAWTRVHHLDDAPAARALLALAAERYTPRLVTTLAGLLRDLVLARCDIAEGVEDPELMRLLGRIRELLELSPASTMMDLEDWAVAVAEAGGRPDQVALIYAASVRGGQPRAAERWQTWSASRFGIPLILPAVSR